jgi:hypothetical protein
MSKIPMSGRAARVVALALALAACAAPVLAEDRADLDRTRIIGTKELPKVLYIVPWKKPIPGELSGRPLKSVLDEALEPIDRDVFRRQVRYSEQASAQIAAPVPEAGSASPTELKQK